jgi:hypothetical protein
MAETKMDSNDNLSKLNAVLERNMSLTLAEYKFYQKGLPYLEPKTFTA